VYESAAKALGRLLKLAEDSEMDEAQVAKNIRKIRAEKSMSLKRLAEFSGLTKGYISKIENSDKAPPFSTLGKIASALNVDIGLLTAEELDLPQNVRMCITRKGQGKMLSSGSLEGYHYEALAHMKSGKNMEPFLLQPTFDEKAIFSHEGEEFMYTIEGIHEFIYDDQSYALYEGDSVYFDSIVPHSGRSIGDKKAKVLAVMYSYKRNSFDTVQERLTGRRGKNF
jgi:transcriptional regulator with XRE-family HTH domain